MKVVFLTLDEVLALHADQIARYGGRPGIRDIGLLESALAAPKATFGGQFLHGELFEMVRGAANRVQTSRRVLSGSRASGSDVNPVEGPPA